MVGYSDATVKLWDVRNYNREVKKIGYYHGDESKRQSNLSHTFAGSIKMDFFASDINQNVVLQPITYVKGLSQNRKKTHQPRIFRTAPDEKIIKKLENPEILIIQPENSCVDYDIHFTRVDLVIKSPF